MKRYLLVVVGDVEPELMGPYKSDALRLQAARTWRQEKGDEDGIFRIDVGPYSSLNVRSFSGAELS